MKTAIETSSLQLKMKTIKFPMNILPQILDIFKKIIIMNQFQYISHKKIRTKKSRINFNRMFMHNLLKIHLILRTNKKSHHLYSNLTPKIFLKSLIQIKLIDMRLRKVSIVNLRFHHQKKKEPHQLLRSFLLQKKTVMK